MKSGWFGPKAFGVGAQPTGWQGWLTTLIFVIAMICTTFVPDSFRLWAQVGLVILILGIIALTYRAAPPP
ncbi:MULTISPECIES: hypothetical protein [unclassified Caulobacter]|uniref:hypothetical protein n=1 Tax=unclassified Caulobacter TaxID=2648921 RepID=UPI0018EE7557|nr:MULTISPECIES: hypothetical protein [unclassified Caulobacter]